MNATRTKPFPYKRVLVTGGAGFIGTHLCKKLCELGCEVTVLDNLSTGRAHAYGSGRVGSVRVERDVRDAVDASDPDLVVHMASVVGQVLAKDDPGLSFSTSVHGTINLIKALRDRETDVLYTSSSAVYGLEIERPVVEADATTLTALQYDGNIPGYATGKLLAEKLLLASLPTRAMIVRPFNVVGPGQTGKYGMVLPRFVQQARAGSPITVYDDGSQTRSFSHVSTFVEVLVRLLVDPAARSVVNVGTSQPTSIHDLAFMVSTMVKGVPVKYVPYDSVFPGHVDAKSRVPNTEWLDSLIGETHWPTSRQIVEELMLACL